MLKDVPFVVPKKMEVWLHEKPLRALICIRSLEIY